MNQVIARRVSLVALILCLEAVFVSASTTPRIATVAAQTSDVQSAGTCSGGASLTGWYGMLVSGSGKYLSGAVFFDGNCNVSGANVTGGTSGQYATTSATGTYGQNLDGTFNIILNFANPPRTDSYIVGVSESGNKARGIESDGSLEAIIDIQSQITSLTSGYTTENLSGVYAASCSGLGATDLNYVTFDGNGTVSVLDYFHNGSGQGSNTLSGTYSVNGDGTFSGSLAGSYSFSGVMEKGITEIEYTYATGGSGVLGCLGKQAQTSPPNLSGRYGLVVGEPSHGTTGGEYFSGALNFDGAGNLSGTVNGDINHGQFGNSTVNGSYLVNSDNTISITMNLTSPATTFTFIVGVSESGNEAAGIQNDGTVIANIDLQSQLQPPTPYTLASLNGTYSASCGGSEIDLNYTTFDGNGKIIAPSQDAYDDGGYGDNSYTGSYTVNSDGTFTANFDGAIYNVFTLTGVIENGTAELEFAYDQSGLGGRVSCIGESNYAPVGANPVVATPTFSPAPGAYNTTQSVTLSDTTPGATIYYTTNGVAPTAHSTPYSAPIQVNATMTIQAIAVANGFNNSAIAAGSYFLTSGLVPATAPTFSPAPGTFSAAQTVTLSDTTSGAVIYYTTDGSTPTTGSAIYGSALTIGTTTTIKAMAVAFGFKNSAVANATYTITLPAAATPTFSPAPGSYNPSVTVTLSDTTSGAIIYYTTNGTVPTTSSLVYSSPILVSSNTTINAIAVATGSSNSVMGSGTYTIAGGGIGSFALVQHVHNPACATATTCSITLNQNIAAGDLLVFEGSIYPASIMTATNNNGAFAPCVSCVGFDPTFFVDETTGGWILSAAAQVSPITVTFNAPASGEIEMWEYSVSGGTPGFDGANQNETLNSATPTAAPFTPSGSNDISLQACRASQQCNAVSSPFVGDNLGNYYAWGALNSPTGWAAPTWTLANPATSQLTQMAFGFGVTPCANGTFVDFGGPSRSPVSVAQLSAGTHGWQGGYWTINGTAADLSFQTAASQPLQQPTGRLCDGGNYTDASTTGLQYSTTDPSTYLQMNSNAGALVGSTVSLGVWYNSSLPATETTPTDDVAILGAGTRDFLLMHEINYGGGRIAEIECGTGVSSGFITLARNTWYWVELVYNVTGNHTMKVYDNSNPPVQVGSTMTCSSVGTVQPAYIALGNIGGGTLPPGYFFDYDGLLVSLDGDDPLLPSTFKPSAVAPTFSPAPGTYSPNVSVTLSDTTTGAAIYYTTDGSTPTTSSTLYGAPIPVSATATIRAIATASGYSTSAVSSGTFTIPLPPAASPTFSPNPGTYTTVQSVSLSDTTSGAVIYYTADGSTPTTSSAQYTGPIALTASTTINAIAVASGHSNSTMATGSYILNLPAAAMPTFSPAPGTYSAPVGVTLSDTTSGAVIHCTTDGTIANANSPVCATITIGTSATVNAIAVAPGFANSPRASALYTITAPGTFTLVQHVHNPACATATTCSITLNQNIAAGDLLVFEGSIYPGSVMTATNNSGAFVPCASCVGFDPTFFVDETSGGWILSAAAQVSPITVTFNAPASGEIEMWEYSVSGGTPGFDGANQNETLNSATPTAAPFTPSGSNDISLQACRASQQCNAVSSPFVGDNMGNYYAWGSISTPTNWSTPTWTLANPATSQLTQMAFGFGVTPCANSTFVDFGGPSGSPVSVAQLSAATHGWQGGYWTINGTAADLTFQTAASQALQQSTGRLCDGGNYTDASTTGLQYSTSDPSTYLQMNGNAGALVGSTVSLGVWYNSSLPATSTIPTDDVAIFGTGGRDFMLMHELNFGGGRIAQIECGTGVSSGFVTLARNTWYWVELVYNVTGNHTMKIYNNSNPPVQVGSTMTCSSVGTVQPAYIALGNISGSTLPTGYFFDYDGLLVSLDGTDPLLPTRTAASIAATPAFVGTPPGTYTAPQAVALSDATPGAAIYYTTDGSTPTTSSTLYGAPISINSTTTIEAIAVAIGYSNSTVLSGTFTINLTPAATPTFSPAPATYTSAQSVTLSDTTTGAVIYYTTNGAAPTTSSSVYSAPISVSATTTIKAIAVASGHTNSATASGAYTITPPAATPTFSPAPGTYTSTQTITLSDTTSGAVIYYTTNGTTPTTSSSKYSSPITVSATTTIEALAVATGYSNSVVLSGVYTIAPPAATPTFSPAPGTYTSTQTVTLSDTTSGAAIYYTTNGTTPTTSSLKYSSPITVSATTTIEAIAAATGNSNSAVANGTYTITTPSATPTFSPAAGTYNSTQSVTLSDTTSGAVIYYTTNGATPTTSSSVYSAPIAVSASTTIQAIAVANGHTNSAAASAVYTITSGSGAGVNLASYYNVNGIATAGTATKSGGFDNDGYAYNTSLLGTSLGYQSVTFTLGPVNALDAVSSATVSLPAGQYSKLFLLGAAVNGAQTSQSIIVTYTDGTTSTFTQNFSDWAFPQSYAGESTVSQMANRISSNGTTQTLTIDVFGYSFALTSGKTPASVKLPSNRNVVFLGIGLGNPAVLPTALTPTFSPAPGTYTSIQSVTLSDTTTGAAIYYTTDGTTPTTSSSKYSSPITMSATTTLKALAVATGYNNSAVASGSYTINLPATATPTFSPAPGTYISNQSVTLSDTTSGAVIYYTTDGTTPTTSSSKYSSPIAVNATTTLKAIAVATGKSNSAVASGTYTLTAATPTLSPAPGTYTSIQSVTLSDTTAGAAIYYTTNGTTPTTSSSKYSSPITLNTSGATTIEAIAVASGRNNSAVASGTYTLTGTAIVPFVQVGGTWTQTASASVSVSTSVNLGPQPISGGSWSWAGPKGYTSTSRQINNIPLSSGTNSFVATYTNPSGVKTTQTFTITAH